MKLRRNIELVELFCGNEKCEGSQGDPVAYVTRKSDVALKCPFCKKSELRRGIMFAAAMTATKAMVDTVYKSPSAESH